MGHRFVAGTAGEETGTTNPLRRRNKGVETEDKGDVRTQEFREETRHPSVGGGDKTS
jgi:hypothetical protein